MDSIGLASDLAIARKRSTRRSAVAGLASAFVAFMVLPFPAHSLPVAVTNLITDDQAVNPASITDSDLKNPWGVS
jgi:hypothetical protein